MKFFFRAFFRNVSTTSAPLTSLKLNDCYCGREGFCVLELAKKISVTLAQRHFRRRYGKPPPTKQSIYDWSKKFVFCVLAKSLIISFQYNIESVCFFYSNPVYIYIYIYIYLRFSFDSPPY